MTKTLLVSRLMILVLPAFLAACGQSVHQLPDDPDNEPFSQIQPGKEADGDTTPTPPPVDSTPMPSERDQVLAKYNYLDPQHIVPTKALEEAVLYFDAHKSEITNQNVLSIIDFSQSSTKKRWYFINMNTGTVWNITVAHGKGSDADHDGFAEKFSNVSGSNASSVGFYKTAETYQGSHGYSLKLDGLSATNSNVRARSIVVHGADYVQDKEVIQGRSWGCPAVSMANYKTVIDLIKGGSIIYATN